jgi:hypothetical protein
MPIVLTTQETEMYRIAVRSQPKQIVHETLSQKCPSPKKAGGRVAQGVGAELNNQYQKKWVLEAGGCGLSGR